MGPVTQKFSANINFQSSCSASHKLWYPGMTPYEYAMCYGFSSSLIFIDIHPYRYLTLLVAKVRLRTSDYSLKYSTAKGWHQSLASSLVKLTDKGRPILVSWDLFSNDNADSDPLQTKGESKGTVSAQSDRPASLAKSWNSTLISSEDITVSIVLCSINKLARSIIVR